MDYHTILVKPHHFHLSLLSSPLLNHYTIPTVTTMLHHMCRQHLRYHVTGKAIGRCASSFLLFALAIARILHMMIVAERKATHTTSNLIHYAAIVTNVVKCQLTAAAHSFYQW